MTYLVLACFSSCGGLEFGRFGLAVAFVALGLRHWVILFFRYAVI